MSNPRGITWARGSRRSQEREFNYANEPPEPNYRTRNPGYALHEPIGLIPPANVNPKKDPFWAPWARSQREMNSLASRGYDPNYPPAGPYSGEQKRAALGLRQSGRLNYNTAHNTFTKLGRNQTRKKNNNNTGKPFSVCDPRTWCGRHTRAKRNE
jgi:hypothetical protein